VVYDALDAAVARGADMVIADTAGRLPTQSHLMEELKRVKRAQDKALPGAPHEVSLSWLDWSFPVDLTHDGAQLVFDEQGDGAGAGEYQVYVRPTDGSPALRLGEGRGFGLSPDGQTVGYSEAWDGRLPEFFMMRTSSPESKPFGIQNGDVAARGEVLPRGAVGLSVVVGVVPQRAQNVT